VVFNSASYTGIVEFMSNQSVNRKVDLKFKRLGEDLQRALAPIESKKDSSIKVGAEQETSAFRHQPTLLIPAGH
jgi:hypothetical protein